MCENHVEFLKQDPAGMSVDGNWVQIAFKVSLIS